MKENKSSTTAEGMAIVRAIEMKRAPEKRIVTDPIAPALVSGFSVAMSKFTIDSGIYDRFFAPGGGVIEFILARERYIDDLLTAQLAEGLDQVVLLGAGFDTRPYRVPGIEQTRVFEVDHPATQGKKIERLGKLLGTLPGNVTFVPIDFNTESLEVKLRAAGYDPAGRGLFILQGVVMYLTAEAVDETLSYIAHNSAAGSVVAFDYFYASAIESSSLQPAKRVTRALGEGITFAIGEGEVEAFLAQRGFGDIHNADAAELKRLYFTGSNADRKVSDGAAIATARTP